MNTATTHPTACRTCQKPLVRKSCRGPKPTFCSAACYSAKWRLRTYGYVKPPVSICKTCGRQIVNDLHRRGRTPQHCSEHCRRTFDHSQKAARVAAQKASLV